MRRLLIALVAGAAASLAFAAPAAFAAEDAEHPEEHAYSFEGPFGTYDRAQLQRGFLVYKQVCASCHGLEHMSYRNLGEPGGPFEAYSVTNHETGAEEIVLNPDGHGHAKPVDVNENPFVRALAAEVMIPTIDTETGLADEREGRVSDRFRTPFANEYVARAANGGALPPDLSVINSARHGGAEYIRSLLLGYTGAQQSGKYINHYFPGGLIAMPPPLVADDQVVYEDGTPATIEQMSTDVSAFLQWAADPHMEARKKTGFMAVTFLLILSLLLYVAYKTVWRGQSH